MSPPLPYRDPLTHTQFSIPFKHPIPPFRNGTYGTPDGDDLTEVQLMVVDLRNKDGGHSFVERSAIHVDGSTHRQHEACNASVNVVVLQQALEGDRQRG